MPEARAGILLGPAAEVLHRAVDDQRRLRLDRVAAGFPDRVRRGHNREYVVVCKFRAAAAVFRRTIEMLPIARAAGHRVARGQRALALVRFRNAACTHGKDATGFFGNLTDRLPDGSELRCVFKPQPCRNLRNGKNAAVALPFRMHQKNLLPVVDCQHLLAEDRFDHRARLV